MSRCGQWENQGSLSDDLADPPDDSDPKGSLPRVEPEYPTDGKTSADGWAEVAGTYRAVIPGDTAGPTAVVAVRYQLRETAHSFAADSGTVEVHFEGGKLSGRIQTTGIENGIRTPTRITYHDVPAPARRDTVSCAAQP